jgi:hypothetical protein
MGYVWRERAAGRWVGSDDDGHDVAFVNHTVWDGGTRSCWLAWLNDGTPEGVRVGQFATMEAAMVATDEAG